MSQASTVPLPANPLATMTPEEMVEKYLQLRDKKGEIAERHKKELAKFNLVIGLLESSLLGVLNTNEASSMSTKDGTFFKHTTSSATVTDWKAAFDFIIDTGQWQLLEKRVSKAEAQALMEERQEAIPGVKIERVTVVQIRRK